MSLMFNHYGLRKIVGPLCRINFLIFIFLLCFQFAGADSDVILNSPLKVKGKLDKVIIDVRGSRGGKGDVAAGYLFGMDLVENHELASPIVFLADQVESSILLSMSNGFEDFDNKFALKKLSDLDTNDVFYFRWRLNKSFF
jgi:hypothetical protein